MKVDIRPHSDGPAMTSMVYIFDHPAESNAENLSPFMPQILEAMGLPASTPYDFSQRAGCLCGCSPGFLLGGLGQEVFATYEPGVDDAYADGYKRGLEWPDAWETHGKPGGPWVYSALDSGDAVEYARRQAEAALSRRTNEAWRGGWARGHGLKLARRSAIQG